MSQFAGNWEARKEPGLGDKMRGKGGSQEPLKPRLDAAARQIQAVMSKLEASMTKLRDKDANLFNRIVSSVQKRDSARASMYANELAEVRKMNRMVTQSKLALEQIMLRLNTITELGEIVATLAPATTVVSNLRQGLAGIMPEAETGMSEISNMLSGILVDAGSVSGSSLNFEVANEEAEMVLSEAAAVAESRMAQDGLPELPTTAGGDAEAKAEEV